MVLGGVGMPWFMGNCVERLDQPEYFSGMAFRADIVKSVADYAFFVDDECGPDQAKFLVAFFFAILKDPVFVTYVTGFVCQKSQ